MNSQLRRIMQGYSLAFLMPLVLIACINNNPTSTTTNDATFDRVSSTKVIRAGYIPYPPNFILDPNTKEMSGIAHDILVKAAENLGWTIEFVEEVGWGSMIEAIDSGRVDIIGTGIWPTASRGKKADFVKPIFYSAVKAYVAAGNKDFDDNLNAIDNENVRIAVVDGEMAAIIARSDFPQAQLVTLTQLSDVSQLLMEVATRKADVTFVEPALALEFMAKNPGKIREVVSIRPVRVFPNSYMVGKGENRFTTTINIALNELINTGYVDRILSTYEKYPGSFSRVSPAYQ